jgi:hypothetical protein
MWHHRLCNTPSAFASFLYTLRIGSLVVFPCFMLLYQPPLIFDWFRREDGNVLLLHFMLTDVEDTGGSHHITFSPCFIFDLV